MSVAMLDRYPLLASSPVKWALRAGVAPFEGEFDLRPEDAADLLKGPLKPITLKISGGHEEVEILNLYALAEVPAENKNLARVTVVDRRWFWSFTYIKRDYNVRRTVGVKRQRAPDTPPELQPLTPEIAYWPWSLKNGKPWTAKEILENIWQQLQMPEGKASGATPAFIIDEDIGSNIDSLPIEDLALDDPGDVALRRALAYLPDADVTVKANGDVRVYSRASGLEDDVLYGAGPEAVGHGHAQLISNARISPSKIHVLFTREHEIRFDFEESDTPTHTADERYLDNVLAVPDYSLELRDVVGTGERGEEVAQGTWLPFDSAFRAWQSPPRMSLESPAKWLRFVRQAMIPFNDLWTNMGANGVRDPNADWMGRMGAVQAHFRRTFRINPRWMARIAMLKASKVATLDPSTGTRAPALVYADYSRMSSQRSWYKEYTTGQPPVFAMNVKASPVSAVGPLPPNNCPATVSISDHDQGIIHFDLQTDPIRMYETLLPGLVELDGSDVDAAGLPNKAGPTPDIDDDSQPIAFNALADNHKRPQLRAGYRVAVILTAIPAGMNSADPERNGLYRVTVSPHEVRDLLPASMKEGLSYATGPEMEIRIGANIETARFAWVTSSQEDIERSFGIGDRGFNIDNLIINLDDDSQGGSSLKSIALAVAARTWAALTDRSQGARTGTLKALELEGSVQSIEHEIGTSGAALTRVSMPGKLPPIDIFSLMPESTRKVILRLAPSPGKAAG